MAGCLRLCFMQKNMDQEFSKGPLPEGIISGSFLLDTFYGTEHDLYAHTTMPGASDLLLPRLATKPGRLSGLSCIVLYKKPSGEHNP